MDDEILKSVESMLGANVKIVDCEKTSTIREEEILLINGVPIQLETDDDFAIKRALITGEVPSCDLLNQLLFRAGILCKPVHLETSLSVQSTMITKEEITVARAGKILDEKLTETKENNFYTSSCKEVWEPIKIIRTNPSICMPANICEKATTTSSSSSHPNISNNNLLTQQSTLTPSSSTSVTSSNYLSHPTSNASISELSLSSIAINSSNNDQTENVNKLLTTYDGKNSNFCSNNNKIVNQSSIISCDSGHEDIFNSLDHSNLIQTPNSIVSSCFDFSFDETDFVKINGTTVTDNCVDIRASSPVIVNVRPQQKMSTIFGTATTIDHHQAKDNFCHKKTFPQQSNSSGGSGSVVGFKSSTDTIISDDRHYPSFQQPQQQQDIDENTLVYRDGNLISGSLNALIQHMVPTASYYPDRSYLFAFLLSSRLFIRPHELLLKVCQICEQQQNIDFTSMITQTSTKSTSSSSSSSLSTTNVNLCQFAKNLIQFLTEWIETFPYDFRDEKLMNYVRIITQKCCIIDTILRKDVSIILQRLLQRLTILEQYESFLESINGCNGDTIINFQHHHNCTAIQSFSSSSSSSSSSNNINCGSNVTAQLSVNMTNCNCLTTSIATPQISSTINPITSSSSLSSTSLSTQPTTLSIPQTTTSLSSSSSIPSSSSCDITDLCTSPAQLANQLTHIELERLSHIGPEEFVQAFAKDNPNFSVTTTSSSSSSTTIKPSSLNDMKKTKNLESYVQWFNRLSYLVATEICKYTKKKQRIKIIEHWIETARECFNIGNFNSLMAIIAGLNMSPISRLKKTWAKVPPAKFHVLEHQMDPSSNFNSYRSTLKAAMWRSAGATDDRQRIVIPFFSLLVKDLYFLNEGCSNKLSNGHINFDKFWQLSKQVQEFVAWKQVTCPFERVPKIIMFLQMNMVLNENSLALASFDCEPPDNQHEKDRYKMLKIQQQQQQQQ